MPAGAIDVVIHGTSNFNVHIRVEARFCRLILLAGRFHIGIGLFQQRVVFQHHRTRSIQRGGNRDFSGHHQSIRLFASDALVVSAGVFEVSLLGQQIVARLCQTGLSLLKVCLTTHALLGTQADLIEYPFVILEVIFCQRHHLLAHQHVEIALDRLQGSGFAGVQHRPGPGVDRRFLAAHFAGGRKTIEDVLAQVDGGFTAVQITQMIASCTGAGVIGLLPTGTSGEIQGRQIATFGGAKILIGGISAVYRRVNFRVPQQAVFTACSRVVAWLCVALNTSAAPIII